jgi:hypothetical protein
MGGILGRVVNEGCRFWERSPSIAKVVKLQIVEEMPGH